GKGNPGIGETGLGIRTLIVAVVAAALTACGSSAKTTTTTTTTKRPADVNGDGEVVVGILSPGDTKDKGYYESFVDEANTFAKDQGWKVVTVDKVPPSQAAEDARNLCRQTVDLVAIAASTLKDEIPVAAEPVVNKAL